LHGSEEEAACEKGGEEKDRRCPVFERDTVARLGMPDGHRH